MAKYDLLAIDLDGTLLCGRARVSEANAAAIVEARRAGLRVTVCTGRGLVECRHITEQIGQKDPVVVAGGAILACPVRNATIHRFPMERGLVGRIVECFLRHDHAALILKDPDATGVGGADQSGSSGHDYLVVSPRGEAGIDPVTRWWFEKFRVPFRVVRSLEEDEHPEYTVRVGLCGTKRTTREVGREMNEVFGREVTLHHFGAVVPSLPGANPDDSVLILEAFDKAVNKWAAITWLAEREGICPSRIAAIGNDINDVAMLENAALGVAMGNAIPEAKAAARVMTLDNESDGVAHAIGEILGGGGEPRVQTLSEIRLLLEARGLRPKRSLGQNFLVDQNLIRKLVDAAGVRAGGVVLEVGPGTGTLTEELLARGCCVVACELDDGLADLLRERMPRVIEGLRAEGKEAGTFELVHGDCLEDKHTLNVELTAALRREGARGDGGEFKLVANLPYGAATPLISTLLIDHPECRTMAVTVQREVVDRLMAKSGTKEFGPLGVMGQSLCEVEKIATAGPQCFWPRPDVTSAMVVLKRREAGPAGLSAKELSEACRVLFAHRRKQLGSVLDGMVGWEGLAGSKIGPTMRAEQLSLGQVVELARGLRKSE